MSRSVNLTSVSNFAGTRTRIAECYRSIEEQLRLFRCPWLSPVPSILLFPFPISHFGRSMLSLVFPFPRLFFFPFLPPPSCPSGDPRGFFGERVSECFPPSPFFPFFAFLSFPFLPSHRLESPPASLIVFSSAVGNPSFYLLPSPIVSHRVNSPSFPSLLAPGRESTSLSRLDIREARFPVAVVAAFP